MSEQALKDAQLAQLQQENANLKTYSRNVSAQAASQKQCIDEYIHANISLRAVNLLQEEDVRNLKTSNTQFAERIAALEKENADIKAELDQLKNSQEQAA